MTASPNTLASKSLVDRVKDCIVEVPDFPVPGILFKDITPLLAETALCFEVVQNIIHQLKDTKIDAVAGIEARGFFLGFLIAKELNVPFVPVRKKGKLPRKTISMEYGLEYGSDTLEVHADAIKKGSKVLIHDDLLATGGTAEASSKLIEKCGGEVVAYSFIVGLSFLEGEKKLRGYSNKIHSFVSYQS